MISNSFFPYLEFIHSFYLTQAAWVNIYDTSSALCLCRRAVVTSSPAFYTPAYYALSRTFLPHFLFHFLPVVTSASRTPAFYP